MATFTIEVSESEKYIIDVNTSTADSFTSSSSQDKFFLEIEQGIEGKAETTKNIIEITTSVDNTSSTNSITIEKVNDINLAIITDFVIGHPTIPAASSVDNNGSLFIQDIFLDEYGHITGINSAYATGTGIGGGASTFLDLTDTPSAFSGNNSKVVAVNSLASALEFISGVLISGTDYHPSINAASSSDNSGQNFIQDILLDNYGHITGIVVATASGTGIVSGSDIYITGITYNSSISELVLTHQSGSVTGILNDVVHSGDNISLLANDSGYATTGQLSSTSGYLQNQIDAIPADTNTFVSGIQYNTAQRDIVLTRTDSVTLTGNLDVVVHSGDNVSKLVNDAGYITGFTETDPIFSASPANSISSGDITNWNEAYGWGDHSTSGYLVSGDNVSLLNNDVPYAVSGSHIAVNAASDTDNTGRTYIQDIFVDEYGHVTGLAVATETVVDTDTTYTDGTGLVLVGTEFNIDSSVVQTGDNISVFVNDSGYINTETDPIFTSSVAYDITSENTGEWTEAYNWIAGNSGSILSSGDNVSLLVNDANYAASGDNVSLFVNDAGYITEHPAISDAAADSDNSGRTYIQDILLDQYGHVTGLATATETVVDTNDNVFVTGITYDSSTHTLILSRNSGSITGILDNIIHSGDNVSFLNNDAGYITGFTETLTSLTGDSVNTKLIYTDENGVANDIDLSWAIDDTNLSRLVSGSIDSSGIATFTRDDSTNFEVDFSILFDDTNLSRITSGNFDTSSGILTLTRALDDTSVSVNLDGRYLTGLVGATGSFDYIDFTNLEEADYPSFLEGRLFYDSGNHALAYYNDEADVTLQIGQEEFLRVRNNTTGTITNGSLVYITGSHANAAPSIDLAIATGDVESAVAGFATHDIEASTFGYVTTFGLVRNVPTSGINAGSEIYLSNTTSGTFTDTSPTVPNYSMPVGYVIREHATNGSILAFIGKHKLGGGDLKSEATAILSGVPFVTTVADNNGGGLTTSTGLVYDSGNQNLYVGGSEVLVSGDNISQLVNDSNFTDGSGTANYIAKWSDSETLTNSIIYDNGTAVGIGTSSPALQSAGEGLHINATGTSSELKFTNSVTKSTASDGTALVATSSSFTINNREAGSLNLNTNNTNAVSIDSAQNVGIGASLPTDKLDVYTNAVHGGITIRGANAPALHIWDQSLAGGGSKITENSSSLYSGVLIIDADTNDVGAGSYIDLRVDGDTKMVIKDDGNVGIGTASPETKLDVRGTIQAKAAGVKIQSVDSSVVVKQQAYSVGNIGILGTESNHNLEFRANNIGYMYLTTSGNVGVGTASPAYKLDVAGSGRFVHADGACGLIVEDTGGSGIHIGDCAYGAGSTYAGIKHSSHTGSSEYMIISQGDHTFISAASGSPVIIRGGANNAKCEIRVYDNGDGQNGVVINEGGFDRDTRIEGTGDQNLFKVDASTDRVGIGTASPSYKLDVSGTFSANSVNVNDSYTFPTGDGTDGQVMTTDGSGNASWTNLSGSGVAKAWVHFNGAFGSSPFTLANGGIRRAFNVSSITDGGVGTYTVNLSPSMSSTNYAIIGNHSSFAGDSRQGFQAIALSTSTISVTTRVNGSNADATYVYLAVFE